MRLTRFLPAAALLAAAPLASAQFSDSFEAYAIGSPIEGQGGWHNWDTVLNGNQPFNNVVGTVGAIVPSQGTKMLRTIGDGNAAGNLLSDTVHELNGPYNAGSGGFTFTTKTYVPTVFSGQTYVIILNEYFDAGGPYDWSFQCSFTAATGLVHMDVFNTAAATIVQGDQIIAFDQWAELKVEIDLNNNTGKSYYNGVHMWDFVWSDVLGAGGSTAIAALDLYPATGLTTEMYFDEVVLGAGIAGIPIGNNYCITNANSTGNSGRIDAYGTPIVAANNVTLVATRLPANAFMYFLTSTTAAQTNNPGGSAGNLCLGGAIGRYTGPGQIQNSGAGGTGSLVLNLTQIPTPTGPVSAMAGQTRNFQCWHRDSIGGVATSNFTDATAILFQ
jgi:hypothetical protein